MFPSSNVASTLDRRFLRCVLELALDEARRSQKDYLGAPHLFLALLQLEGGCTQDALDCMGFSSIQVGDTFRLALGSGKAVADTPILPTRRCKEILGIAERIAINARATAIDERAIAQAIVSERTGVIYELLQKLGIDLSFFIEHILSSNAHALLELTPSLSTHPDAASPAMGETVPSAVSMHDRRDFKDHEHHLATTLAQVPLPLGITIRVWAAADFPTIQHIGRSAGWSVMVREDHQSVHALRRLVLDPDLIDPWLSLFTCPSLMRV